METKVIKLLGPKEVLLGAGLEQGVKLGQTFEIYEIGDEVFDPETKASLGTLEIIKGHVDVVHVQPKFCTARAATHTIQKKRYVSPLDSMFLDRVEHYEVEVDDGFRTGVKESFYDSRKYVKVGDLARLVQ